MNWPVDPWDPECPNCRMPTLDLENPSHGGYGENLAAGIPRRINWVKLRCRQCRGHVERVRVDDDLMDQTFHPYTGTFTQDFGGLGDGGLKARLQ